MDNTLQDQELLAKIIEVYIKNKDIERLESALELAISKSIPNEVKLKGSVFCGDYFLETKNYLKAIKYLNISRSYAPTLTELSEKSLQALIGFYNENKNLFSKNDLKLIADAARHFLNVLKLNFPDKNKPTSKLPEFIFLVDFESKYIADDAEETRATFKVQQIFDSYYQPNTYQEVLENFAFSIEDDFREFIEKESEEPKKEKKENPNKPKDENDKGKDDSK